MVDKDLEGSSLGLFEVIIPHFIGESEENMNKCDSL
jgi:hypothetical protein